jgi:hypothetical protein
VSDKKTPMSEGFKPASKGYKPAKPPSDDDATAGHQPTKGTGEPKLPPKSK